VGNPRSLDAARGGRHRLTARPPARVTAAIGPRRAAGRLGRYTAPSFRRCTHVESRLV
jgi:hypothetical protein